MSKEIKDRIEEVKAELDELYEEGMEGAEALHKEVEVRIAELRAEYSRLQNELRDEIEDTVEDAKGFYEEHPWLVIGGAVIIGLILVGLLLI